MAHLCTDHNHTHITLPRIQYPFVVLKHLVKRRSDNGLEPTALKPIIMLLQIRLEHGVCAHWE